ncbi:MAG: hypothetical protein IKD81_02565 [Eubacteriaceae bacterium]|nr:hypothetical protein [Eubacteriaceae bacterium]
MVGHYFTLPGGTDLLCAYSPRIIRAITSGTNTFGDSIAIPVGLEAAIVVIAILVPRHLANFWLCLAVWAAVIPVNTEWVKDYAFHKHSAPIFTESSCAYL